MRSPLYNINDGIDFFILASFFILTLRVLPFSTHCWYRGTHCTESTKPPNSLTLSMIYWTFLQCVSSKSTLYWRPWLFTIPQCRAGLGIVIKQQQRVVGNLHMAACLLHMGFVCTEKNCIFWSRQVFYKKVSNRKKFRKVRRSVDDHKIAIVNLFRVNLYA